MKKPIRGCHLNGYEVGGIPSTKLCTCAQVQVGSVNKVKVEVMVPSRVTTHLPQSVTKVATSPCPTDRYVCRGNLNVYEACGNKLSNTFDTVIEETAKAVSQKIMPVKVFHLNL